MMPILGTESAPFAMVYVMGDIANFCGYVRKTVKCYQHLLVILH